MSTILDSLNHSSSWLGRAALLATLLALLFTNIFRKSGITRDGKPMRKPPNTLPLAGNGLLFLQARQKLFAWFVKCERIFGRETYELYVPSLHPGVVINDPRNLEFVLKNESIFTKGDFVKQPLWDLFGHGIVNADGELWRVQRKAGLSFLNNKNLQVLTNVALPQYLSRSIRHLKAQSAANHQVDLQGIFHEITSQLMGRMAYNMEMHADDDMSVAFDYASGVCAERVQNPLWRIKEIFFGHRMRKSVATVKAFGKRIVDSAIRDREKGTSLLTAENDKMDQVSGSLIQSLLDAIGDEKVVADAALNYLSAGRDTTAQSLTWAFYLLLNHRYVYAKVRMEVKSLLDPSSANLLGSDSSLSGDSAPTDLASKINLFTPASLPYTYAVLLEALRLFPPIPFEIRQAQAATTLPDGTFLPASSIVVWCPWAMHRSQLTWGEDAEAFRPERWLAQMTDARPSTSGVGSGSIKVMPRSVSEFPVFSGGPRTCLGKKMAEVIGVQAIAAMAWSFDFVPAYQGHERTSKSSLTLPMDGGLPVFVKVRNRGSTCVVNDDAI